MAHYALIGSDNIVKTRIVVSNDVEPDEASGIAWCVIFAQQANLGVEQAPGDFWKKTSYNGNIRKNFAGDGFTWDVGRDAFIPPRLSDTAVLNEETCRWEEP